MRHYQLLDSVTHDKENDTLIISGQDPAVSLWFGREGMYLSVSASVGPLEVALRPRLRDLKTSLAQLRPTERLAVMRMVGTGQAHLELGLTTEGQLLVRTTIVADATGHFAVNMLLSPEVRQRLFDWLDVEPGA